MSLAFWCLFLFAGIASFIHGGIEQHMPGYVESIGFTASFAALIVSAQSLGSVFDKLVMGWLNDKLGVRYTTLLELICIIVGIAGFIVFHNPVALIVSAILFGVQDSLMSVSLPMLIREIFGSRNYTEIHAWIRTGVGLFGSFSGVLVGASYDQLGSFVPAFVALIGTCVVAMGCVVVAYRVRRKLVWTTDDGTVVSKDERIDATA
ncbi:MAG: MFS transporter [Eggerthellaceae bacterium]|nr:MFS transporter [Eggerthellaceae bacterium]